MKDASESLLSIPLNLPHNQPSRWPHRLALEKALENLNEAVIVTDARHRILGVNGAFCRITGYRESELLGRTPRLLRSYQHSDDLYIEIEVALSEKGAWEGELRNRRKDGTVYPWYIRIRRLSDERGRPGYYLGVAEDLSPTQEVKAQLEYLTRYDSLTGLPKRSQFLQMLGQSLKRAGDAPPALALMTLQLKNLPLIRDELGLEAADEAMRQLAVSLVPLVDTKEQMGRLFEDTLALALPDIPSPSEITPTLRKLLETGNCPLKLTRNPDLPAQLRVGISLAPIDGHTASGLLDKALLALRQASDFGPGYQFYSEELATMTRDRLTILGDLRQAQANHHLTLFYQPKVRCEDGALAGAEALLRWIHPTRGLIPPSHFIPLAEEFDLILPIGRWVIEEVCRQMSLWLEAGYPPIPVAINLSPAQLHDPELVDFLAARLRRYAIPPETLELELTESMLAGDPDQTQALLHRIKALGVHLSLDDFGTGYSCLSYLTRLPFDKLKVDRTFVTRLPAHRESRVLADTIIAMAHNLGMSLVAEGVETAEQFSYLKQRQCEEIQGYYYSKPLPEPQFRHWFDQPPRQDLATLKIPRRPPILLLVDDEPNILATLKRSLRKERYQVMTAGNAGEALQILKHHPVQVVLTDQRMPDMEGTVLLERIKQAYPDTVRMILSGYADLGALMRAINQGEIYRFIAKPWRKEELLQAINSAFDKYEQQVQLNLGADI